MEIAEIMIIGNELRKRRLMGTLVNKIQDLRDTNVRTSVYNAFNCPYVDTEFLNTIRREGKRLLAQVEGFNQAEAA